MTYARPQPQAPIAPAPIRAGNGQDVGRIREIAEARLQAVPRLHTKAAQRRVADVGGVITFHDQRDNQGEIAALRWLRVAPLYAVEARVGDTLANLGADVLVQRMVAAVQAVNGHKTFVEAVLEFERLRAHMRQRGAHAAARAADGRANANDVCMFLETRRDDAHEQYAPPDGARAQYASAALNALSRPQKRGRTGVHAAPNARKKLKHLCDDWNVDIEIDQRVRIRNREPDGPGYVSEKAPAPPLFMMKGLQTVAADSSANPFARMIARALCLLAFGGFREEQTHLFGVLAVGTHDGRPTMYCKTKRKSKHAPTEYAIVPLSGVLNDDGAWMEGGADLMRSIGHDTDFFLPGFDAPPGKNANNPYAATRVLPAPMTQNQMDLSIAHVLSRDLGYDWSDARLYTRHSFKHFLPEIIGEAPAYREHLATEQCNDVMRWANSVLADNPSLLSGADRHRDKYIASIAGMPRNYSECAQVKRLRLVAQHHLDRAHRAITKAGAALPRFGGFELLEP
jgi:hypothetical protein